MTVFIISKTTAPLINLTQNLKLENIETSLVERWENLHSEIGSDDLQFVVLICPSPEVEGLRLCRQIRNDYHGILILITEKPDPSLNLLALEMGADIVLPLNAGTALITAQIKALLRRFVTCEPEPVQTFGHLTVDANRRDVFITGQPAQLSTVEFNLLWLLVKQAGRVVSRERIHNELYNSSYNGYDRGIDIYISRIRKKIGDNPVAPRYLKTVRGVGYQFVAASSEQPIHSQESYKLLHS
ncbi:two-component system, OmpR family, response regulator RstA [Desulfuromusa kysingii]|uniref:Two-component system, OmpR family, response regulator RstA n=1 Tax=Desulfuromusa kysingii TaxID=37625 RepID=A0A1H3W7E7_9BACT|nr:response regulator transcription factor [Desulfuromusa kysingii]SDZ83025.1 two-component system, OmpR family, response regulator RstA [Desulfuromusa kysingii]